MVNLSSFIRFHATRAPERIAVAFKDQQITFAELLHRIERTAGFLAAQGIGPDDVVAVVMKNSAAFLELAFAVSHLGAIFLPINFRLVADEVEYITGNAEAKLVFADAEFAAAVANLPSKILLDDAAQSDTASIAGGHASAPMHVRKSNDLFRLMYTSGTTDRPKGVMHTYDNFYWKCIDHVIALGLNERDRLLVTGPLYHVGAFDLPGVAVLWVGGMLRIHRDFDVEPVLDSIARDRLKLALGHRRGRADPGVEDPPILGIFHAGPLRRRLWADRILQRRHLDGGGARDRKDRVGRPRTRAC